MKKYSVLLVEDDQLTALSFLALISKQWAECECFYAKSLSEALKISQQNKIDISFIDMDLENPLEGLELIKKLKKSTYKVVLTSHEDQQTIFKSYSLGCNDFLGKPINGPILTKIINKFLLLRDEDVDQYLTQTFLTQDEVYLGQLRFINKWALSDVPLLILGPTGSGKSHLAKEIHSRGKKDESKLMHLNCAEIPEALFEGELFGYKKGAFTGATQNKKGKLEMAHEGTLFLDEIGSMPLSIQQKFLRVLEEKTFYPLGSEVSVTSNFRIICATCDNLEKLINEKKFRSDLFFRLKGEEIVIPSLGDRRADIAIIVEYFLSSNYRKIILTPQLMKKLASYSWPGNMRELFLLLNNLASLDKGILDVEDWQDGEALEEGSSTFQFESLRGDILEKGLACVMQELESKIVMEIFRENKFKVRETMRQMKMSNATFYKILGRAKV